MYYQSKKEKFLLATLALRTSMKPNKNCVQKGVYMLKTLHTEHNKLKKYIWTLTMDLCFTGVNTECAHSGSVPDLA